MDIQVPAGRVINEPEVISVQKLEFGIRIKVYFITDQFPRFPGQQKKCFFLVIEEFQLVIAPQLYVGKGNFTQVATVQRIRPKKFSDGGEIDNFHTGYKKGGGLMLRRELL